MVPKTIWISCDEIVNTNVFARARLNTSSSRTNFRLVRPVNGPIG